MKKNFLKGIAMLSCMSVLLAGSCLVLSSCENLPFFPVSQGEQSAEKKEPEKVKEIEDVTKGYWATAYSNELEIDLNNYIKANGNRLTYRATTSDPAVAEVSVSGKGVLTATLKGKGEAKISIDVECDGKKAIEFSFTLTSKVYKKIACVGDSLTRMTGYPEYLTNNLRYTAEIKYNIGVTRFGQDGITVTGHGGTGVKYQGSQIHTNSLATEFDLITIMLGTNDANKWSEASATYKADLKALVESYQSKWPNTEIMIITSPPTTDGNGFAIPNSEIESGVNPIQKEVAQEMGLHYYDLHTDLKGMNYSALQYDGVHFSEEGFAVLGDLILNRLFEL